MDWFLYDSDLPHERVNKLTTLLSDIFEGRKFRSSKKPRDFCIFYKIKF